MEEPVARVVKNEALFRVINEQIEGLNDIGPQTKQIPIVCECGSSSCAEVITIDRDVYEDVRAQPERFVITPGHEIADVEDVLEEHPRFTVVAKKPGLPRSLAEETDPRR